MAQVRKPELKVCQYVHIGAPPRECFLVQLNSNPKDRTAWGDKKYVCRECLRILHGYWRHA